MTYAGPGGEPNLRQVTDPFGPSVFLSARVRRLPRPRRASTARRAPHRRPCRRAPVRRRIGGDQLQRPVRSRLGERLERRDLLELSRSRRRRARDVDPASTAARSRSRRSAPATSSSSSRPTRRGTTRAASTAVQADNAREHASHDRGSGRVWRVRPARSGTRGRPRSGRASSPPGKRIVAAPPPSAADDRDRARARRAGLPHAALPDARLDRRARRGAARPARSCGSGSAGASRAAARSGQLGRVALDDRVRVADVDRREADAVDLLGLADDDRAEVLLDEPVRRACAPSPRAGRRAR